MIPVLIGLIVFGVIFAVVLGVFLFVFWILMLIDVLKRKFKSDAEKIAWVLVIIFVHILGAVIYYFVVKTNKK